MSKTQDSVRCQHWGRNVEYPDGKNLCVTEEFVQTGLNTVVHWPTSQQTTLDVVAELGLG